MHLKYGSIYFFTLLIHVLQMKWADSLFSFFSFNNALNFFHTLEVNLADDKWVLFFCYFSQKIRLDFHVNCLQWAIHIKGQSLLLFFFSKRNI